MDALAAARAAVAQAAADLAAGGARTELRVESVRPRAVLGIPRAERLRPAGRVWRLGVLLLDDGGALFAVGTLVRAADPGHSALQSRVATERRELRVMARRAGIPDGESVDIGARPLPLDGPGVDEPLALGADGAGAPAVLVRWAPGAVPLPLADYLAERVALLLDPPVGA